MNGQKNPERAATGFLRRSGWGSATIMPLPGDASTRRYARLDNAGKRALLMDQPQGAESVAAGAFDYNKVARLAGADCNRFIAVSDYLRSRGLAAPEIYAADPDQGYLIIEDFGDALFADVLEGGGPEEELYKAAVEVLAKLHAQPAPGALSGLPLHVYDEDALLAETDLLTEWFLPLALGRPASDAERESHRALWRKALDSIAGHDHVLVHRDYHAQNLLWMPDRHSHARVGLIDFQDAVAGSRAYDLVSLLEDARRDVPPAIAQMATAHYLASLATPIDEEKFRAEMAVMAAQRNAKIVGIFARLYMRDGKPRYLALLPRVWAHLERDLAHPVLADLRAWYDQAIPKDRRLPEAPA